ncbi:MAG: LysE family translocator [Aquificaceae bacterium]|nr:MAG: LysE family translocator [Aquificaceae bacterium]
MDLSTWFLFVAVTSIMVISPGPAILLAITNSISYGLRATLYSTLGNEIGLLFISSIAILGLGAVLQTSTTLFLILKTIGAAYLIYLGIKQWHSKVQLFSVEKAVAKKHHKSDKDAFMQGFLVAATNPKAILFFTALLPQFVHLEKSVLPQFVILIATFTVLSACALIAYGVLAHRAKKWLSTTKRMQWFNRIFGGLFITLGLGLSQLNHKSS